MMRSMNFPSKWTNLIQKIIETPVFSIILEGESKGYFGSRNGLRQGDPISPILFTIVMEYFTLLMEEKVRDSLITPIKDCGNSLTHLIYADGIILFTKADEKSALAINEVFRTMQKMTGLELSCDKSNIYFGKGVKTKSKISSILNIQINDLPVKYLGIPLTSVNLRDIDCSQLIDKVKHRIDGWETRFLSLLVELN